MQNLLCKLLTWLSTPDFSPWQLRMNNFSCKSPHSRPEHLWFPPGFWFSPVLDPSWLISATVNVYLPCFFKHLQIIITSKEFARITLSSDYLHPENIQIPLSSWLDSCWYSWELILGTNYEAIHTVTNICKQLGTAQWERSRSVLFTHLPHPRTAPSSCLSRSSQQINRPSVNQFIILIKTLTLLWRPTLTCKGAPKIHRCSWGKIMTKVRVSTLLTKLRKFY